MGLLELNPYQELTKHNRPVREELIQICGTSKIKLFDGEGLEKEVVLHEGKKIVIPARQYHIHSNQENERSITLWQFEGDIVDVIKNIKKSCKRVL